MVSSKSGSFYAQMSLPDMRTPILDALAYPSVMDFPFKRLNFNNLRLDFAEPDSKRYPCLNLARKAACAGGAYPLVFNTANELAVEAFIAEKIRFIDIPVVIESCLEGAWGNLLISIDQILEVDLSARETALSILRTMA
jgi:1-deoxy-D-xylulose-5-phosphate reductoisomerase